MTEITAVFVLIRTAPGYQTVVEVYPTWQEAKERAQGMPGAEIYHRLMQTEIGNTDGDRTTTAVHKTTRKGQT